MPIYCVETLQKNWAYIEAPTEEIAADHRNEIPLDEMEVGDETGDRDVYPMGDAEVKAYDIEPEWRVVNGALVRVEDDEPTATTTPAAQVEGPEGDPDYQAYLESVHQARDAAEAAAEELLDIYRDVLDKYRHLEGTKGEPDDYLSAADFIAELAPLMERVDVLLGGQEAKHPQ